MANLSPPPRSARRIAAACWLGTITLAAAAILISSCTNPASTAHSQSASPDALAVDLNRRLSDNIQPLLKTYCYVCHTGASARGDVRMDSLTTLESAHAASDVLGMMREMIKTREMPPRDKEGKPPLARPTDHERLIIEQWLDAALAYVPPDAKPDPGWFTIHRLNRVEYRNTIRDLLGIDPKTSDVAERIPRDDTGYGFDNNADVLTVSPLALEQYLDAAERAIDHALGPSFKINSEPQSLSLRATGGGHEAESGGVYLYATGAAASSFTFPATGEYLIRITAWETKGGDDHANLSLRIGGKELKDFEISGSKSDPQEVELRVRIEAGKKKVAGAFTNDYYVAGVADRNLGIESISIAGPLDESTTDRPAAWKELIGSTASITDEGERAGTILKTFATRAYRRPLDEREQAALLTLYKSQRQTLEFEPSLRVCLSAILTSPNFLYRSLNNPASSNPSATYRLSSYELASRLSYFLWSSMPDAELLDLAAKDQLKTPETLRAQIKRMIADPRSDAFIQNFTGQWLQLRTLETLAIDKTRFPQYDDAMRADMISEASTFFGDVVRNDRSILSLLNSDYTFVNDRLAAFYGIDGVEGPDFRRVSLSDSTHRGGVLTMAGVLTVTSNTTRTSPVKRGFFILDQFMGTPPPPPPADIPPLEQAHIDSEKATLRERLAAHVANPSCAVCHNRLDPIGLSLENYDAIGRWRDEENGAPIDSSGTLPGGVQLAGAAGLKRELLSRSDQFVETLSGKVLTYAIGRGLEPFDRPAVRKIANQVKQNDNRFDALIEAVVLSDTFRTCRGRPPKDGEKQ